MKHMISSFKMKGDVISDHFLMLWFQKDSLDTVSFRTYWRGVQKAEIQKQLSHRKKLFQILMSTFFSSKSGWKKNWTIATLKQCILKKSEYRPPLTGWRPLSHHKSKLNTSGSRIWWKSHLKEGTPRTRVAPSESGSQSMWFLLVGVLKVRTHLKRKFGHKIKRKITDFKK